MCVRPHFCFIGCGQLAVEQYSGNGIMDVESSYEIGWG